MTCNVVWFAKISSLSKRTYMVGRIVIGEYQVIHSTFTNKTNVICHHVCKLSNIFFTTKRKNLYLFILHYGFRSSSHTQFTHLIMCLVRSLFSALLLESGCFLSKHKHFPLPWPFFYMKQSWTQCFNLSFSLNWGIIV